MVTTNQVRLLQIVFGLRSGTASNELLCGIYFQILCCRNGDSFVVSWVIAWHIQFRFNSLLQESHLRLFTMNKNYMAGWKKFCKIHDPFGVCVRTEWQLMDLVHKKKRTWYEGIKTEEIGIAKVNYLNSSKNGTYKMKWRATWHLTSIWVSLSKSILVGFPDINLWLMVPATQYLHDKNKDDITIKK